MYILHIELKLWWDKEKSKHSLSHSCCCFLCRCPSFQWRYDCYYIAKINTTMQMYMVYLRQLSWMVWGSRGQIFWSPTWVIKSLGGYEKEALKIYFNSYFAWFLGLLYFVKHNKIKSVLRKINTSTLHDENLFFAKWKSVPCKLKLCSLYEMKHLNFAKWNL